MLNSKVKSIPEALDAIWKPDQAGYKTKRPPGEGENLGSLPSKLTHPRNGHECRGTEKVGHWVRVLQRTNIIPLCKHGLANIVAGSFVHVCVCVCVCVCGVSFCLASSRHRLTGKASRLYLFINLLGTGNERQGQYIIVYMGTHKHTSMYTPFGSPIGPIYSKYFASIPLPTHML